MEVESFENEEVAKLLNDWFVSIKVVLCSLMIGFLLLIVLLVTQIVLHVFGA
jgi:hypothetical protein